VVSEIVFPRFVTLFQYDFHVFSDVAQMSRALPTGWPRKSKPPPNFK